MWALDEELETHFDRIKARRRSGSTGDDDDDDDDERGLVVRNEYARGRGRGR